MDNDAPSSCFFFIIYQFVSLFMSGSYVWIYFVIILNVFFIMIIACVGGVIDCDNDDDVLFLFFLLFTFFLFLRC